MAMPVAVGSCRLDPSAFNAAAGSAGAEAAAEEARQAVMSESGSGSGSAGWGRVYITDPSGQIGVWYRYTGPVWSKTGLN